MSKFVLPMIDLTKMENFTYVYKLLIIDKDPQVTALAESVLTMKSYSIRSVADIQDAIEVMKEWQPDLVLLDLVQDSVSSLSFLEQLSIDKQFRTIRTIVLTGIENRELTGKALQYGATGYLLKPLRKEEVLHTVQQQIQEQEQQQYIRALQDNLEKKEMNYATVSNQLRSSLHSIRLMSSSLLHTLNKDGIEEDERLLLLGIYNETAETALIWDNFHKSNHYNPERCKPKKQRVDINSILCNIANAYLPVAQQKNITLFKEGFDTELLAEVDIEMFRSIIRNLLSDAIRENVPGGQIILSSYGSPEDNYTIKIQRPSTAIESREKRGNGWQLCNSYAQAHNGKIWFDTTGKQGASWCFSFTS